jgi:hypothetical protein
MFKCNVRDLAEWLECLAVDVKVATVLGLIPGSSDPDEAAADEAVLNKVPSGVQNSF